MTTAPAPPPVAGSSWRILGLVVLGGALGAMARAALLWPGRADPLSGILLTAVINIVGALALGVVVGVMGARHPRARAFLGTGVLGGFTTFSAFAVQIATSVPWAALLLAVGSMVLGVAAAGVGVWAGRALGRRHRAKCRPGGPGTPGAQNGSEPSL